MEEKYIWERRTPEWIKENPGKGTMYKRYIVPIIPEPKKVQYLEVKEDLIGKDAGVYVIFCDNEMYAYVGQSLNMDVRMRSHKMYMSRKSKGQNSYINMKRHINKHGMDGFRFVKHFPMPFSTREQLLERECLVMGEVVRMGYTLYNKSISMEMVQEYVSCPKDFQPLILKTIDLLASSDYFVKKLTGFVNGDAKLIKIPKKN
jgi:hypothetical protein